LAALISSNDACNTAHSQNSVIAIFGLPEGVERLTFAAKEKIVSGLV